MFVRQTRSAFAPKDRGTLIGAISRDAIVAWLPLLALALIGCSGNSENGAPTANIQTTENKEGAQGRVERPVVLNANSTDAAGVSAKSPAQLKSRIVIRTSLGDITVELDAERAPVTVNNFLDGYVDRGFYSDTIFHHVDKEMLVAAGGYTSDLQPKSTRAPIRSEADNGLKNVRGAVAMIRQPDYPDSADSQFFINVVDNSSLDFASDKDAASFGYCVFGKVVAGMEVVDKIASTPVASQGDFPSVPTTPVVVQSIERLP